MGVLPPLSPALPPPQPDPWFVQMSVAGGASLGAELAPLGQLDALGVWSPSADRLAGRVLLQSDLRLGDGQDQPISDLHTLELSLGRKKGALSAATFVGGSLVADPWTELGAALRLSTQTLGAPLMLNFELGPIGRQDASRAVPGLLASANGELKTGSRMSLLGSVEQRSFGEAAPSLTEMAFGLRFSPLPVLSVRGILALWSSLGPPDQAWADQVIPGSSLVTATLTTELDAPGGWSVPISAAYYADLSQDFPSSLALRAGLSWSRSPRHVASKPRTVSLCVSAPGAHEVEVGGTFTGWDYQTLDPRDHGLWCREMTLSPGVHTYVYRVDGVVVTPSDAQMVRQDEFGVRQGVLVVGQN